MEVVQLTNGQFADTETGLIADSETELICKVEEFNCEFNELCKSFADSFDFDYLSIGDTP